MQDVVDRSVEQPGDLVDGLGRDAGGDRGGKHGGSFGAVRGQFPASAITLPLPFFASAAPGCAAEADRSRPLGRPSQLVSCACQLPDALC